VRGRPRAFAHRPLPSGMMPICVGTFIFEKSLYKCYCSARKTLRNFPIKIYIPIVLKRTKNGPYGARFMLVDRIAGYILHENVLFHILILFIQFFIPGILIYVSHSRR
jgi:hypothetical protein